MSPPEEKTCPACLTQFECKSGYIEKCHCINIKLNDADREFIMLRYTDCLCASCLMKIKSQHILGK